MIPQRETGWDFVDNDNDPMDFHGHGSHVTGTVAAVGNNGDGITGVMWTARVMSLRSLDMDGAGTVSDAIRAIRYALKNGARVINASWGTTSFSWSLLHALRSCERKGVLVVAAAGNDSANTDNDPFYPASYNLTNIISVAATDRTDYLASFSNWGPSTVDVTAPGVSIYSTWRPSRRSIGGSFPDDVESGPGDWTTDGTAPWDIVNTIYNSPTHCWADSPSGDYNNNTDSWLILPRIDLSGRYRARLTFYLRMETETDRDFFSIEASINGVKWTNISGAQYSGFREDFHSVDISAYDGQPAVYLRFRLVTDSRNTADGVYIDDVDVVSISHSYDGNEFQFLQGTSMAAPHVSGLAGLILATYPALSLDHLRSRIFNGVDELHALMEKLATGGRINANNSLRIPSAPIGLSAPMVSETEVKLRWIDTSVDEEGFTIERREKGDDYKVIARVARNTTSFSDGDLSGQSSRTYRVFASNDYGNSGYSNKTTTAQWGGNTALASGRGGGGGGCFIATAAYGLPDSGALEPLRRFRDEYLVAHPIGRKWVEYYYRYSPPIAEFVADHPAMRKAIRITLYPLVAVSAATTTSSPSRIILISTVLLGLFSTGILTLMRKSHP
jgi:subtilisin family serine protease